MSSNSRQMHLAVLITNTGSHIGGWRLPEAASGGMDFELLRQVTLTAERGKFDTIFLQDSPSSPLNTTAASVVHLEVLTLLAALAVTTKNIGLSATVSTTYTEPYNVARMFASIDHMSGGRAGWNVVTTADATASKNFGLDEPPSKDERYARAKEYVEVAKGLWDSWEDDALVEDKASGVFVDKSKRYELNHNGKFFSVKGPLNVSRSPQGYPVIIQAGSSPSGIPLAAAVGEVIFMVHDTIAGAKGFIEIVRNEAAKLGRDPNAIRFLPGLAPIVADSEEEAHEILARLGRHTDPDAAWYQLSVRMGIDVTKYPPEGPIPKIPVDEMRGYAKVLTAAAERYGFNLRQLRDYGALAAGHTVMMGPPRKIADEIQEWFEAGACDGFNLIPPWLPGSFDRFVDEVVPILQERGIFRTDYTGTTLREHLGIPRPPHPAMERAKASA